MTPVTDPQDALLFGRSMAGRSRTWTEMMNKAELQLHFLL